MNLLEDDIRCPLPLFSSRLSPAPPLHSHSVRFPPLLRQPTNSTMWPCVCAVSLPLPPSPCMPRPPSPVVAGYLYMPKGRAEPSGAAGAGAMDTGTYSLFPFFPSFLVAALLRARSYAVRIPARTVREEGPPRNRSCRQHMYDTSLVTINCVAKYLYGLSSFHL